ncbi:MAG: DUF4190 domain-containing protein [Mycobacterium sp.]
MSYPGDDTNKPYLQPPGGGYDPVDHQQPYQAPGYQQPSAYPEYPRPTPYPEYPQPSTYPPPVGFPQAGGYPMPGGYLLPRTQPSATNGPAIASLVTGIISLPTIFLCLGVIFGIAGVVLGIVALSQLKNSPQGGKGMAIAGIATGGVGILIGVLFIVFIVVAASTSP